MKNIDWFEEIEVEVQEFFNQTTLNFAQRGAKKY